MINKYKFIFCLQYHSDQDPWFGSSLFCLLFLLLLLAALQVLLLPRTLLLLFLFLAAFVTIAVTLIVLLAARFVFASNVLITCLVKYTSNIKLF